jgi:hypothetical protein
VSDQLHALAPLRQGKEPLVPHCIGGWIVSRTGLDDAERRGNLPTNVSRTPTLRAAQPIAIPYMNRAISAPYIIIFIAATTTTTTTIIIIITGKTGNPPPFLA